jgi:hypothetical protein
MMSIRQQGGVFGRNPKFNDVEVESLDVNGAATVGDDLNVGNGVLFVDKSTGRVGVNTSTPDQILTTKAVTVDTYHNIKTDKASGTSGVILANDAWTWVLRNNGGNSNAFELRNATSGQQELTVTTAGNFSIARGNLAFASGKGIDFSATSGTGTSELFDDYEEGTFTPTITDGSVEASYGGRLGRYTKVGRAVHIELYFIDIDTTGLTAGNSIVVGGLPFSHVTQQFNRAILNVQAHTLASTNGAVSVALDSAATTMTLIDGTSTQIKDPLTVAALTSGLSDLRISGTYEAA